MSKNKTAHPGNGTSAVSLDDLSGRLKVVENFISELMPAVDRISKEVNETLNELRVRFERDESLVLLKKVGDNIPVFIELLDLMKVMRGMLNDIAPVPDAITGELTQTINDLRYRYEREETLTLLKKVGDNIPVFVQLLDVFTAFKGMFEDVYPAVDGIMKELNPTINKLRLLFEKDETLDLLVKTGENVGTFNKLLDFLKTFSDSGELDFTLETFFAKETEYLMRGMEKCAVRTMHQLMEQPLKAGFRSLFSAMTDPEVQKGFVLMTTFARNMPQCMIESIEDVKARSTQ